MSACIWRKEKSDVENFKVTKKYYGLKEQMSAEERVMQSKIKRLDMSGCRDVQGMDDEVGKNAKKVLRMKLIV